MFNSFKIYHAVRCHLIFNHSFCPVIICDGHGGTQWAGIANLWGGCTVRGSNAVGDEIFFTRADTLWSSPNLLYNGYRVSFPGQSGRDVASTTRPYVAPRLKKGYS
jgi:hypothetical protein